MMDSLPKPPPLEVVSIFSNRRKEYSKDKLIVNSPEVFHKKGGKYEKRSIRQSQVIV
jgi:hypothetical protein